MVNSNNNKIKVNTCEAMYALWQSLISAEVFIFEKKKLDYKKTTYKLYL